MDKSVFGFIWRYSFRQQMFLFALTLISFPPLYLSLELPKRIVNEAIHPEEGKAQFPREVWGYQLDQIQFLLALSFAFLFFVIVNGAMKYAINVYKGQLGERMLRRLRYHLFERVLRFPLTRFRKVSSGEIIPMITAETEQIGGFIGDAVALPMFNGGQLLVYLGFIFVQDPWLGLAAVSFYPFQMVVIPKLQRRVNQLAKQRVRKMRSLADRIGETIGGIGEVRAHHTPQWHLADFSHRMGDIFEIRFDIYKRKFFIKFLNNFLNQLVPFFFYSIGGYLVIRGQLSFGALVAVLAAYKDLAAPWKELLRWYQVKEDVRVKYDQVVEAFSPPDLLAAHLLAAEKGEAMERRLTGTLELKDVAVGDERARQLDGVTASLDLGKHTAVVAAGGTGKEELAFVLARLQPPDGGCVEFEGRDWYSLPASLIGRRLAYVGPTTVLASASLLDNLLYPLRHSPIAPAELDEEGRKRAKRRASEAEWSGNSTADIDADWLDLTSAGLKDAEELYARILALAEALELSEDLYHFGLQRRIDPAEQPQLAEQLLHARERLHERLREKSMEQLIDRFDPDSYNPSATVAENLLFGMPLSEDISPEMLAGDPAVLAVLREAEAEAALVAIGQGAAVTMVDLFADLPPGSALLDEYSFLTADEIPTYQQIVARADQAGLDKLSATDRLALLALAFRLVPKRHRLGLLTEEVQDKVLAARRVLAEKLPESIADGFARFDPQAVNPAATVMDNMLWGKIAQGAARGASKVRTLVTETIDELGLRPAIQQLGLQVPVGVGGSRMSAVQRQKIALLRAMLKRPDVFILNEPTVAFDIASQQRLQERILQEAEGRGVVWMLQRAALASGFDTVLVLRQGRLVESGSFDELNRQGSVLQDAMAAE